MILAVVLQRPYTLFFRVVHDQAQELLGLMYERKNIESPEYKYFDRLNRYVGNKEDDIDEHISISALMNQTPNPTTAMKAAYKILYNKEHILLSLFLSKELEYPHTRFELRDKFLIEHRRLKCHIDLGHDDYSVTPDEVGEFIETLGNKLHWLHQTAFEGFDWNTYKLKPSTPSMSPDYIDKLQEWATGINQLLEGVIPILNPSIIHDLIITTGYAIEDMEATSNNVEAYKFIYSRTGANLKVHLRKTFERLKILRDEERIIPYPIAAKDTAPIPANIQTKISQTKALVVPAYDAYQNGAWEDEGRPKLNALIHGLEELLSMINKPNLRLKESLVVFFYNITDYIAKKIQQIRASNNPNWNIPTSSELTHLQSAVQLISTLSSPELPYLDLAKGFPDYINLYNSCDTLPVSWG
ncbi:hypothetical protein FACS189472_09960 [Alphaproteobacteria bacterium]|nr:hypothetical protein FACS189472_09960 [Alphaproteobacteria bacterium]